MTHSAQISKKEDEHNNIYMTYIFCDKIYIHVYITETCTFQPKPYN